MPQPMRFSLRAAASTSALMAILAVAAHAEEPGPPDPDRVHTIKGPGDVGKLPADARSLKVVSLGGEAEWAALAAKAPEATRLQVAPDCEIPDGAYASIAGMKRLQSLDLSGGRGKHDGRKIPKDATEHLSKLASLRQLNLQRCGVVDATLEPLGRLTGLVSLNLDAGGLASSDISDAAVVKLVAGLKQLSSLSLERQWNVGDAAAAAIARSCPAMVSLDLATCHALTDKGVADLAAGLSALTELDLTSCEQLTDKSCAALAGVATLKTLSLGWSGVGDAGCEKLAAMSQLESLDLGGCEGVSDKGLEQLARLGDLKTLVLDDSNSPRGKVTDAGLKHVAKLKKLRSLSLNRREALTDAGLAEIAGMSLSTLKVQHCAALTDATLRSLAGCASLDMLQTGGCKGFTAAGLAEFRKARPDCFVNSFEDGLED